MVTNGVHQALSISIFTLCFISVGCRIFSGDPSSTPADVISSQITSTPAVIQVSEATPTLPQGAVAAPSEPNEITLTFWTIERFSDQDDLVAQHLQEFERLHPDIRLQVFIKRPTGQASTLNFLKTAKPIAPAVLPDLVVLNTDDLPQAWRGALIQPLNGLLDDVANDLLPAARRLGTVDNNLAAIPFELTVEHLAYNVGRVVTTPLHWQDVISGVHSYQFPAAGQNGLLNDSLLIQYLSTGAKLVDDQGSPIIDEPALRTLLTFYQTLRDKTIINPEITNSNHANQLWDAYLAGTLDATHINSRQYLIDRRLLAHTQAAPIPTFNGTITTVGHGWAFALVTEDENRQTAATQLISILMKSNNNLAWANRAAIIPTSQQAFRQLIETDDVYWQFLNSYLDAAQPLPAFAGYEHLSRILLVAMQQVINGEATPDEAIVTATDGLNQLTP